MNLAADLRPAIRRFGAAGIVLLGIAAVLGWFAPEAFFHAYLFGFIFWVEIALGALAFLQLQYLTGGAWGVAARPVLEAAAGTLPVFALLFLPLCSGLGHLYPWATGADLGPAVAAKRAYLNVPFFLVRAALYFLLLCGLAALIRRRNAAPEGDARRRMLSGPGLVLYVLVMNFASVDWVMSLEPTWYSTMFVVEFIADQALAAIAFVIVVLRLAGGEFWATPQGKKVAGDLGNLLLTFVIFWAYVTFSQWLIIWSGNLPEEIAWYLHRRSAGWSAVIGAIALSHFFVPFFLLLQRPLKTDLRRLARIAGLVLCAAFVEVFWIIKPSFSPAFRVSPFDLLVPLGIGGVWLAAFLVNFNRRIP